MPRPSRGSPNVCSASFESNTCINSGSSSTQGATCTAICLKYCSCDSLVVMFLIVSSHIGGRPLGGGTLASSGTDGGGSNFLMLPSRMSLISLSRDESRAVRRTGDPCPSFGLELKGVGWVLGIRYVA